MAVAMRRTSAGLKALIFTNTCFVVWKPYTDRPVTTSAECTKARRVNDE